MRLASLFQDHAVLQRDLPIPVWGSAAPGERVTVTLAGETARVAAADDGRWLVRFRARPAGGPFELAAESASGRVVVRDLLVGEVWLCSGQSNMEWTLNRSKPFDEVATAPMPEVRLLTVQNPARLVRQAEVVGRWEVATPEALAAFSAVGCWFGRRIHAELGVPVGLICTAWGGTRIQAWISREALMQDLLGLDEIAKFEGEVFDPTLPQKETYADYADWEKRGAPQDAGNRGLAEGWAAPGFADGSWQTMPLPSRWQSHGHPGSGVFWFRRTVVVPPPGADAISRSASGWSTSTTTPG